MEIKPIKDKMLMSEELRNQFGDGDEIGDVASNYVHVIADRRINGQPDPITGLLSSILFSKEPEIEFKVQLDEALRSVKESNVAFHNFELQHGSESSIKIPGPFIVVAARIQDIDVHSQTCILALHLKRLENR